MSFINAFQNVQKQLYSPQWTLDSKNIETLLAVLAAARENTTITERMLLAEGEAGKLRTLKINYYPPVCEDDGTGDENICDAGEVLEPAQDFFELSQVTSSKVYQLNVADIRKVDGRYSFSDHAMFQIMSVLPTVREKLSSDIAALLVGEVGILPDGNTTKKLPFIDKANMGMNPAGLWEIRKDYADMGYSNPYVIGGSDVNYWKQSMAVAAVNNTTGIDMARINPGNLFYDNLINETFADYTQEHIIAFTPQQLKFITFSENAGIFATNPTDISAITNMYNNGMDGFVRGALLDPRTGILWDLNIDFDKCANNGTGAWKFQWKLHWDIFFLPARVCNKQGVNGITHYTTCLAQVVDCGDSPAPSPAPSANFSASAAGLTYPLIIQKAQIKVTGGAPFITNEPNPVVSVANITELASLLTDYANGSVTFGHSGSNLTYTGWTPLTVVLNDTTSLSFS